MSALFDIVVVDRHLRFVIPTQMSVALVCVNKKNTRNMGQRTGLYLRLCVGLLCALSGKRGHTPTDGACDSYFCGVNRNVMSFEVNRTTFWFT